MIYTVTFNPSIDYIVNVDNFMTGVVNRTSKEIIFPGGKGIINDKVRTGEASSDGTFIRRNYVYTVNVKLKRLGGGSSNPEVPADPASLDITVEPQDWTAELVQDVEW